MDPEVATISKQTEIPVSEIPQNPSHRRKIPFVLIALFILFVIGAFFAGIYYKDASNKAEIARIIATSPTPEPPSLATDITSDWQSFTSSKYQYSLKYPKGWYSSEEEPFRNGPARQFFSPDDPSDQSKQLRKQVIVDIFEDSQTFRETHEGQDPLSNFNALYAEKPKSASDTYGKIENTKVNGLPAVIHTSCYTLEPTANFTVEVYYAPYLYTLTAWESGKCEVDKDFKSLFDQILKTVTFTESSGSVDMSDWKTYSSSYEGLSFQYPPDWKLTVSKNFDVNAEDVTLQSPDGLVLSFNPYVSGLGGGCDPSNCPLVKTRSVTRLPNANSKVDLYLVEGTSNNEKRLGIMGAREYTEIPKVGEKKTFPYYLVFTSRKDDIAAFMLYDEYKENSGREFDKVPEEEFFSRPDVQTARQILSSLKYY